MQGLPLETTSLGVIDDVLNLSRYANLNIGGSTVDDLERSYRFVS